MENTAPLWLNPRWLKSLLSETSTPTRPEVESILDKAMTMENLTVEETASLMRVKDPELKQLIRETARKVKGKAYGDRIIITAPLHLTNICSSECTYCPSRVNNKAIERKRLSMDEIREATTRLVQQGHKRMVLAVSHVTAEGLHFLALGGLGLAAGKGNQHAELAAGVEVVTNALVVSGFHDAEGAELHVFAGLGDEGGQAFTELGLQGLGVSGFLLDNGLGGIGDEVLEVIAAGHEVGLALHGSDGDSLAVSGLGQGDQAFGRGAAGLLGGLGHALFTQEIDSLFEVAVGGHEGLLAVHHAGAGFLAQVFYHRSSNGHISLLFVHKGSATVCPRKRCLWSLMYFFSLRIYSAAGASASAASPFCMASSAFSASSALSLAAASPSMQASAKAPTNSLMARMASSLPGIT